MHSVYSEASAPVAVRENQSNWSNLRHLAREILLDLAAIVWPCACVACGAPDRELCADCRAELQGRAGAVGPKWVLTPSGVRACVAGPYEGPLRAVLVGYKHGDRTRFAGALGAQLRAPLRAALAHARSPAPLAVTVPSRPARVRERGYRHVDLLVRRAIAGPWPAEMPRPALLAGALRATAGRTGQVGLSAADRRQNAARVRVPKRMRWVLHGREVVLVDDIITTGATVDAAARALAAAGANVVGVAAVCATERLDRKSSAHRDEHHSYVFGENRKRSPIEVEVNPPETIGFEKGVKVRPAEWPPA